MDADEKDKPTPKSEANKCSSCSALPDDITVNTGRDESFPSSFNNLVGMDGDTRSEFLRCPSCNTYFNWIDMPQMYGSGNNSEERLVRLPAEQSRLLHSLLSDSKFIPDSNEVREYINILPLTLLLPALRFTTYDSPEVLRQFIPQLILLLGKNNDTGLWSLLNGYIYKNPKRAEELLDAFQSNDEYPPSRLVQILHQSLRLVKRK